MGQGEEERRERNKEGGGRGEEGEDKEGGGRGEEGEGRRERGGF